MCGINGFVTFSKTDNGWARSVIKRMNNRLKHRGPDAEGIELFNVENKTIALGHRRLSIIDLSVAANQPMYSVNNDACIVFNGEIYNYKEIRNELKALGYKFKTECDTEVILNAYHAYGVDCLHKLNGIFAFAIYNITSGELFLARDRVGVKPLIYSFNPEFGFVFSSEIKGVKECLFDEKSELDNNAIQYYFSIGYIPAPYTIYKNIKKLEPAHFILIKGNEITIKKYWKPDYSEDFKIGYNDYLEGLKYHLNRAVKMQLVSDVPVGAFLSGGVDSSAIVSLMAKHNTERIKTFSIGFNDASYNELNYANIVADKHNTEHYTKILEPDPLSFFNEMINHLDEPFADTSSIPTFLVSKMASEHVKVVLSGDGGDELFAGYDWHVANNLINTIPTAFRPLAKKLLNLMQIMPYSKQKKGIINILQKLSRGWLLPEAMRSMRWHCAFTKTEMNNLFFRNNFSTLDYNYYLTQNTGNELQDFLLYDLNLYLPNDCLVKVDLMSMANSIESRVPLLDHELIEFAAQIPYNFKNKGSKTKMILKDAMFDLLPVEIQQRRKKQGFSIPFSLWMHHELKEMVLSVINDMEDGFFNKKYVLQLFDEHNKMRQDNGARLRSIIIWLMWHKQTQINEY